MPNPTYIKWVEINTLTRRMLEELTDYKDMLDDEHHGAFAAKERQWLTTFIGQLKDVHDILRFRIDE